MRRYILSLILMLSTAMVQSADQRQAEPEAHRPGMERYHKGVIGGPHDFTDARRGPTNPCAVCHIPHLQAIRVSTSQPSTQPAVEVFRIESQRRVFQTDRFTPGPTSLICLGCHDGTMAGSTIGTSHALLAGAREGFDLPAGLVWRDHPIGIAYPSDRENFRPMGTVLAQGNIVLPDGRLECISCHDPHNRTGIDGMLVMPNRKSALCLSCHIK